MKKIFYLSLTFFYLSAHAQDDRAKMDWPNLKKYADSNKLLPPKMPAEKRVVFMGNSITEGWKRADSSFFANREFIDRGISGQTTPQMLLRFRPDVIDLKPDAVVILAGINDIAENTGPITLEAVFGNIVSMAELAKANNIKVLLCSVLPANTFPWRLEIKPAEKVISLNAMLETYAKKNNLTYVNYYPAMVDDEKGLDKRYTKDGVHPTLEGYKIMDALVVAAIKKTLKRKK
ncbi:MAG: SGNH/GDSL hydrolase family protein [Ferruginibacter sp.]